MDTYLYIIIILALLLFSDNISELIEAWRQKNEHQNKEEHDR